MNKKVIIDCDPGIDDCFAIMLCMKHLDVAGITTVGGNTQLEFTQKNARYITELAKREDIPVHAGYEKPLFTKLVTATEVHGSGGLGDVFINDPKKPLESKHAVDFLIDSFMNRDDLSLITLAPLTNIAQALMKEPRLKERIPEILMMGGSVTAGNYNATAEFNIYVDPEAAQIVFESGIPIRMVGLNLTRQNSLTAEDVKKMEAIGNPVSDFAAELLRYAVKQYGDSCLCDACTVAWMIDPEIIPVSIPLHIDVETKGEFTRGMTVCDYRDYIGTDPKTEIYREKQLEKCKLKPNAQVAMEFDSKKFSELLYKTLEMYGEN